MIIQIGKESKKAIPTYVWGTFFQKLIKLQELFLPFWLLCSPKSQFDEIFENIPEFLLFWIYDLPFNLKPISYHSPSSLLWFSLLICSLSESANNALLIHQRGVANRTNSNSLMSTSSDLYRNNSTHSYQSARSTRSNMTAMTTLSSRSGRLYLFAFHLLVLLTIIWQLQSGHPTFFNILKELYIYTFIHW